MPRRSRRELESNRVARQAHPILGAIFGALIGASLGLGTCLWVIPVTLLFPGDTMLLGAVACGYGGYRYGDPFIEWLGENWWRLS